jgi:hypothetical protein
VNLDNYNENESLDTILESINLENQPAKTPEYASDKIASMSSTDANLLEKTVKMEPILSS